MEADAKLIPLTRPCHVANKGLARAVRDSILSPYPYLRMSDVGVLQQLKLPSPFAEWVTSSNLLIRFIAILLLLTKAHRLLHGNR